MNGIYPDDPGFANRCPTPGHNSGRSPGFQRLRFSRPLELKALTMAFADNLRQLPAITHIAALHLLDDSGAVVATIPNAPGKAGSVTVYNALAAKHGSTMWQRPKKACRSLPSTPKTPRPAPARTPISTACSR